MMLLKCCTQYVGEFEKLSSGHRTGKGQFSYSIVLLYLFDLFISEGLLISPCYFMELCVQWVYLSLSPLPFSFLLSSAICKTSSDNHFTFLHFFFFGIVLVTASCKML